MMHYMCEPQHNTASISKALLKSEGGDVSGLRGDNINIILEQQGLSKPAS